MARELSNIEPWTYKTVFNLLEDYELFMNDEQAQQKNLMLAHTKKRELLSVVLRVNHTTPRVRRPQIESDCHS